MNNTDRFGSLPASCTNKTARAGLTEVIAQAVMCALFVFVSTACGSFQIQSVDPELSGQTLLGDNKVSQVRVAICPDLAGDKIEMLNEYAVPDALQAKLAESYRRAGKIDDSVQGLVVSVTIDKFRNPNYGAAFIGGRVVVADESGSTAKEFRVHESTRRAKPKPRRLGIIAQGVLEQIVNGT